MQQPPSTQPMQPVEPRSRLMGLMGPKGCGKDTVASYLSKTRGYTVSHFADPLKQACQELFLLDYDQLYGDRREEVDPRWQVSPRQILQFVGTEMLREKLQELIPSLGSNFHIERFKLWYQEKRVMWQESMNGSHGKTLQRDCEKQGQLVVVVADVRFRNEVDAIHALGGKVYRIVRPSNSTIGGCTDMHASEQELLQIQDDIDGELDNSGSLDDLYRLVDRSIP